ncbi:MAG: hypothetical protein HYU64_19385 [Armatimonadetes bacterium]|nr:hypothetical protein [Armatimonadota bacterium]
MRQKGEVLWLHSSLKATVQALPTIIDDLRTLGYEVAALPPSLTTREEPSDIGLS